MALCLELALAAAAATAPLVPAPDIVGDSIPEALEGRRGDAARGRQLFLDRDTGHCVLCHAVGSVEAPFAGNVGPNLSEVGARLTAGQLRLRVVDYSRLDPGTVMPAYYRVQGLNQVEERYRGRPVLTAQQIEDVVAFLATLDGAP